MNELGPHCLATVHFTSKKRSTPALYLSERTLHRIAPQVTVPTVRSDGAPSPEA